MQSCFLWNCLMKVIVWCMCNSNPSKGVLSITDGRFRLREVCKTLCGMWSVFIPGWSKRSCPFQDITLYVWRLCPSQDIALTRPALGRGSEHTRFLDCSQTAVVASDHVGSDSSAVNILTRKIHYIILAPNVGLIALAISYILNFEAFLWNKIVQWKLGN